MTDSSTTQGQLLGNDIWVGPLPPKSFVPYWWDGKELHFHNGQSWETPVKPRPLTYVAGPYSPVSGLVPGLQAEIKEGRFRALTLASCMLAQCKRWNPFSPITHSHPMHQIGSLRGDWEFWKKIDTEYLSVSERIVIVTLDGWEKSIGVNAETEIAKSFGLSIWHMTEPEKHNGKWTAWLTDNHTGEYLTYDTISTQ